MNAVRRTITLSAAGLVAAASMIPLARIGVGLRDRRGLATPGQQRCLDLPQPATGLSIAWLWIGLAVVLAAAAAVLLVTPPAAQAPPGCRPR